MNVISMVDNLRNVVSGLDGRLSAQSVFVTPLPDDLQILSACRGRQSLRRLRTFRPLMLVVNGRMERRSGTDPIATRKPLSNAGGLPR